MIKFAILLIVLALIRRRRQSRVQIDVWHHWPEPNARGPIELTDEEIRELEQMCYRNLRQPERGDNVVPFRRS